MLSCSYHLSCKIRIAPHDCLQHCSKEIVHFRSKIEQSPQDEGIRDIAFWIQWTQVNGIGSGGVPLAGSACMSVQSCCAKQCLCHLHSGFPYPSKLYGKMERSCEI